MTDHQSIEWCIAKFLSKFKAAYPDKEPPSREFIEAYIFSRWQAGKNITYPLAGLAWNQVKWEEEYKSSKAFPEAKKPDV